MSDIAVQLVDPEDNSQNQYPRTLAQLVATANGSDVETELGKKYEKPSGGIPASDIASGVIPAAQIQSDWNQSDNTQKDFIKNKPTIPAAQVNSDWNAGSGVAQILNKPTTMTPSSHTHGNIQNGGTLQTNDIAPASGDKLVITDGSDSGKVARSNIEFNSNHNNKFLRKDGSWETPPTSSGGISDVALQWSDGYASVVDSSTNTAQIVTTGAYSTTTGSEKLVATMQKPQGQVSGNYIVKYDSTTGLLKTCTTYSDMYVRVGTVSGNTVSWNNVGLIGFGGIIIGNNLSLSYDSNNHTVTLSATGGGGGSYSAGDGIDITSGSISVTTAYASAVGSSVIGGLLVTADANCSAGFCNTDDVVAVPIFHGAVSEMAIQDGEKPYDENTPLSDFECHYVNVRAILDAIIDDKTGLLDILKQALEK